VADASAANLGQARKPCVFRCLHSGSILGEMDGQRLMTGGLTMVRVVTLTCSSCMRHRVWRPIARQGGECSREMLPSGGLQ
jgi:hypothetical protein